MEYTESENQTGDGSRRSVVGGRGKNEKDLGKDEEEVSGVREVSPPIFPHIMIRSRGELGLFEKRARLRGLFREENTLRWRRDSLGRLDKGGVGELQAKKRHIKNFVRGTKEIWYESRKGRKTMTAYRLARQGRNKGEEASGTGVTEQRNARRRGKKGF